ncbi:MAG: hypothetical protein HYR56_07135 [Acidobacteria bacterium]|nr:hypothetical protein [Acidobacteriota bacterium]MBI3427977.1 hypothetical protein [Acidobacteriota bacterium]
MSNAQVQLQPDRWEALHESYLRLALPWRLGELAVGLGRARSFSDHNAHQQDVKVFLDQCVYFIEWLMPDVQPAWQADLLKLKQELVVWLANWPAIWDNAEQRAAVATQAGCWSDKFLQHSGLLDPEINPR